MSVLNNHSVRTHASQLWRFIICGGTGFVLDISSLTLFVEYLHIDQRLAIVLSTVVGAVFVFFANKFFTFRSHNKKFADQAAKFALVYGVSFFLNITIANILLWIGLHYLLAKAFAVAIGAVWNYALSHGFIFKKTEEVDVAIV